jgi:hypothetical protein
MIRRYLAKRNNPWELLLIALLYCGPGIGLLLQRQPVLLLNPSSRPSSRATIISSTAAHVFGGLAVTVGMFCIVLYFYARWAIAREDAAPAPHFLDLE